jgi:hypothetical protein
MIRDRMIESVQQLRRYNTPDQWTPETIVAQLLIDVPEIAALDGLQCRDCGANQTELDRVIGDGLCDLCRDTDELQAVPA